MEAMAILLDVDGAEGRDKGEGWGPPVPFAVDVSALGCLVGSGALLGGVAADSGAEAAAAGGLIPAAIGRSALGNSRVPFLSCLQCSLVGPAGGDGARGAGVEGIVVTGTKGTGSSFFFSLFWHRAAANLLWILRSNLLARRWAPRNSDSGLWYDFVQDQIRMGPTTAVYTAEGRAACRSAPCLG